MSWVNKIDRIVLLNLNSREDRLLESAEQFEKYGIPYERVTAIQDKEQGAQKFFLKESNEELTHYEGLVNFMNDMGDIASMPFIPKITNPVKTIGDALSIAYQTELDLLKQYQKFYEDAERSGDCITSTFLIEYMQIQRKSVGEYGDLISRYEKNEKDVFEFDEYMGDK